MPEQQVRLIVGLGNPGDTYRNTRHNLGFMVVDRLVGEFMISLGKRKFEAVFGRGVIENHDVILAKPMAYMNRSGPPVRQLAEYFRISSREMLVMHDDIDLAFGRLKINEKGGHGGHKGVRSLMDAFGGGDFPRLRMGVGRGAVFSGGGIDVSDHVLGRFSDTEQQILDQVIERARDAVLTILFAGTEEGMNRFNRKQPISS